jgi:hypothetical protein
MFLSSPLFAHEGRPAQACIRTVPTFHTPGFEAAHLSYIQQQSTNPTSHAHPSQLPRVFNTTVLPGTSPPIIRPHRWQFRLRSVTTQERVMGALHWTPTPHSPPCQSQPRNLHHSLPRQALPARSSP